MFGASRTRCATRWRRDTGTRMTVATGSHAFTDPNTRLLQHARERPGKIFIESPDQGARITFGEFEALTRRFANFLEAVAPKLVFWDGPPTRKADGIGRWIPLDELFARVAKATDAPIASPPS